ncbi:MAG: hypothetical protein ACK42C_09810, partial [Aquificaceae bacterium]
INSKAGGITMSVMKGVNFWSFLFASQMGGWAMVVLDMVYAGWFGLFGVFPGTKDWGWVLKHQIDATLFAIPLVLPYVWRLLPGPGLLKGIIYGVLWHIFVMIVSFVGSLGNALWFQKPMPVNAQISTFVLHAVWGGVTGFLYNPPQKEV